MNRRLILSREDFGSSHVAPAAAPARYELISSHHFGVIAICAPYILVLFLWECMEPLIPLDIFVAPEWEEHKSSSYFTEAEGCYKSSYESPWSIHINWCF